MSISNEIWQKKEKKKEVHACTRGLRFCGIHGETFGD